MQRSRQSSVLNTYAGDRFSDDDDDDSGSDTSEDQRHEQFHDAYGTVFEACLNDDSSNSSVQSEEVANITHEDTNGGKRVERVAADLKSTASSEVEAEDTSFIYPCEDEDQRPDLDALISAYSLLRHAQSLDKPSTPSTSTVLGKRIRFETFSPQDFEGLQLVPPSAYLEASVSPKQVKQGPQDPHHSHVKGDSGFEDEEMLKPLIRYSSPPVATWTSYKPLPVIDAQTGLLQSPSNAYYGKPLPLPVKRFRQPTFPEIKRQELPPLSDDDDEIVDLSSLSKCTWNKTSVLPPGQVLTEREQPAPISKLGSKPIESNRIKDNVISAGQTSNYNDALASSNDSPSSLVLPPANTNEANSDWENFRPTRSKAASANSSSNLPKSIDPSWDYPKLVRSERTSSDTIIASPAPVTSEAPASTVSSATSDNTIVCHTCGSILIPGSQFDSTSSDGEDKVSSVSSSPSLVKKEAFSSNSDFVLRLDEAEPGAKGSTIGTSTTHMNVRDDTSSLAFSQAPTGDGIGHWKVQTPVNVLDRVELSTAAGDNAAILPHAKDYHAIPVSTSSIPSDIAYGWGPEEAADSSGVQESYDKIVTTLPPATGIGWDDDVPHARTKRHPTDSWDPDVAIKKVPTPGYNISSKARSPTNSAAHPDRQLAPSLDLIRARYEPGDAASFKVGHTNGNVTAYENKTIPSGVSCIIREPTIPHTSSGGFTQGSFASQRRLF